MFELTGYLAVTGILVTLTLVGSWQVQKIGNGNTNADKWRLLFVGFVLVLNLLVMFFGKALFRLGGS